MWDGIGEVGDLSVLKGFSNWAEAVCKDEGEFTN